MKLMLFTHSVRVVAMVCVVAGCGAKTVADDYRVDAGHEDVSIGHDALVVDGPVCRGGEVMCGAACVDTRTDPNHCGRCNNTCGRGGVCSGAMCTAIACPDGLTRCGGACVDTRIDGNHCGACGRGCGPIGMCVGGTCRVPFCAGGRTACPGGCVDLQTDRNNCGACGRVCADSMRCTGGSCIPTDCAPGLSTCGVRCIDLMNDPTNCGRCGLTCSAGMTCSSGRCTAMVMPGSPFRIDALLTTDCLVREHGPETGDDRGGIAVGTGGVYYTGDTRTVRFDLETLLPLPTQPAVQRFDGIIGSSSLSSLLTLASGTVPMTEMTSIIDAVLQVNADLSLGSQVPLGSTVFVDRVMGRGGNGIFTNDTAVMFVSGSRAVMFTRSAPRPMEFMVAPLARHNLCESWAIWGALENIDGVPWVSYVRDSQTIVRQNTMTGEIRTVSTFMNLADMCSFAIDPLRSRWYFHHEFTSQFRTGDETIGRCAATFLR